MGTFSFQHGQYYWARYVQYAIFFKRSSKSLSRYTQGIHLSKYEILRRERCRQPFSSCEVHLTHCAQREPTSPPFKRKRRFLALFLDYEERGRQRRRRTATTAGARAVLITSLTRGPWGGRRPEEGAAQTRGQQRTKVDETKKTRTSKP